MTQHVCQHVESLELMIRVDLVMLEDKNINLKKSYTSIISVMVGRHICSTCTRVSTTHDLTPSHMQNTHPHANYVCTCSMQHSSFALWRVSLGSAAADQCYCYSNVRC